MKYFPPVKGFSLIELLVALSILAVVAAIIVPRLLNLQSQADAAVAQQMQSQINTTYAQWRDAGGTVSAFSSYVNSYGSAILYLLGGLADTGTNRPTFATIGSGLLAVTATDPENSPLLRLCLPASTSISLASPSNVVVAGDYSYFYNPGSDNFQVLAGNLANLSWNSIPGDPPETFTLSPSQMTSIGMDTGGTFNISTAIVANTPVGQSVTLYTYDGASIYYQATVTNEGVNASGKTSLLITFSQAAVP